MGIVDKTCTDCNISKPLSEYDQYIRKGKLSISNFCKTCRRKKNNANGKLYYENNKVKVLERQAKQHGTPEYNEKHRGYKKSQNERLTSGIVASWLAKKTNTTAEEIRKVPGIIEAERSRLLLLRKIKEHDTKDENLRVCSHCHDKKPIDEFRLRTERRPGKEPYTYRSGQCKPCESKIKNSYTNGKKKQF